MSATTHSNRRAAEFFSSRANDPARTIGDHAAKAAGKAVIGHFELAAILCALFVCWNFIGPAPACGENFQVTPLTQANVDADGKELRFPNYLFYDRAFDETYLSASGGSQVIVYSGDFFPLISFASGRGIDRPYGGFVDKNGLVYVCQGPDDNKPSRISVFNGAFILVREMFLDKIPAVSDFVPRQLVIGRDGLIYVAGRLNAGLVVLDNDGNFLRWVQPMDQVSGNKSARSVIQVSQAAEDGETAENGESAATAADQPAKVNSRADIPEEFRPKSEEEKAATGPYLGAVIVQSVSIDNAGNLYILSSETSKIYVYNAEETFLFSFGKKGGTPRTLSQPRRVAIDEDRQLIYVVDFMRHSVLTYGKNDGTFLFEFGGRGTGPGWFNFPTDIIVNRSGYVVVADLFNNRVQLLEVKYHRDIPLTEEPPKALPSAAPVESPEPDSPPDSPLDSPPDSPPDSAGGVEGGVEKVNASAVESQTQASLVAQPDGAIEEEIIEESELPVQPKAAEESPDDIAIGSFVRSWAEAWERKDVKAYLSHYAKDFSTPGGISMAAWEKQRYQRIGTANFIKIDIRDLKIKKETDTRAQVTFIQDYTSDTYGDLVAKSLDLVRENGGWAIATEEEW